MCCEILKWRRVWTGAGEWIVHFYDRKVAWMIHDKSQNASIRMFDSSYCSFPFSPGAFARMFRCFQMINSSSAWLWKHPNPARCSASPGKVKWLHAVHESAVHSLHRTSDEYWYLIGPEKHSAVHSAFNHHSYLHKQPDGLSEEHGLHQWLSSQQGSQRKARSVII